MLELKLQLNLAWPTALLTSATLCDEGCYQRLANPTCAVYVTGGEAEARENESPGCNIAFPRLRWLAAHVAIGSQYGIEVTLAPHF
jgi:hypothetical protein